MMKKLFSLYNVSDEQYCVTKEYVDEKNYSSVTAYSFVGMLLAIVLFGMSLVVPTLYASRNYYFLLGVALLTVHLVCRYIVVNHKKYTMFMSHLFLLVVYAFGILVSVYNDPNRTATTFIVFVIALPLTIIDRPVNIAVQTIFINVIFCVCAMLYKEHNVAVMDVTNALTFMLFGIVLNAMMANIKLREIYNMIKLEHESEINERHYNELKEKDILLSNLLNNIPGGIAEFKINCDRIETLYVSEGVAKLLGMAIDRYEEVVKDEPLKSIVYEEDYPKLLDEIMTNVPQGKPVNAICRLKKLDGNVIWTVLSATKIRDDAGKPVYNTVFIEMPERVSNYANICEEAPIPIYITDTQNYELLFCNEQAIEASGQTGKPSGRKCYEYFMHKTSPCENCNMCSIDNEDESIEQSITMPGNNKVYTLHGKMMEWNNKKAFLSYLSDDTYRINDMENKQKLKKAKEDKEAQDNFLARMSHDLRTPLNAIIGFSSDEMLSGTGYDEKMDYFKKINSSSKYLLSIINDILERSKIDSGKISLELSDCAIEELFASIQSIVLPLYHKKNIQIKVLFKNITNQMVLADKKRMEQIFVNILSNAIKFTPNNGVILVCIEMYEKNNDILNYRVSIRDNGIGMSKNFIPHIFEPFSQETTNDNQNKGTGLGLSIVKSLVNVMKGNIYVNSEKGVGTVFVVELPLKLSENISVGESGKALGEVDITGKRVLLCEDHPLNAEIAKRLIESKGARVDVASNGEIGLNKFLSSEEFDYDIILMDIRMPVMDGIETTKAIRAIGRKDAGSIPIIAMTANAFDDDVRISKEAGMNEHLAKPVNPQKLYETLQKYLCDHDG